MKAKSEVTLQQVLDRLADTSPREWREHIRTLDADGRWVLVVDLRGIQEVLAQERERLDRKAATGEPAEGGE